VRILRSLFVAGLFGVSLTIIGFTCVDRLDHPAATPMPTLARPVMAEPLATGSITAGGPAAGASATVPPAPEAPAPVKAAKAARKAVEGFDTERLNALMRGDPSVTLSRTR